MNLRRGLRCEPHPSTRLHYDGLVQVITPEHPWSGGRQNEVDPTAVLQHTTNSKRWLCIRVQQNGAIAAASKRQLEPGATSDIGGRAIVARPYRSKSSSR
jgi:hypothetical protein